MKLLLPDQVYVLSSSRDYLMLFLKLFYICFDENFGDFVDFWLLNDVILLHILGNNACGNPLIGPHPHIKSPMSIEKASEWTKDPEPV